MCPHLDRRLAEVEGLRYLGEGKILESMHHDGKPLSFGQLTKGISDGALEALVAGNRGATGIRSLRKKPALVDDVLSVAAVIIPCCIGGDRVKPGTEAGVSVEASARPYHGQECRLCQVLGGAGPTKRERYARIGRPYR